MQEVQSEAQRGVQALHEDAQGNQDQHSSQPVQAEEVEGDRMCIYEDTTSGVGWPD
jgi:hypothetical protein